MMRMLASDGTITDGTLIVSKSSSRDTRIGMGRRLHAQPDLRSWTSPLEGRVLYGGNRANEARNLTHHPLSPRGNGIRDFYPRPRGGAANGAGGPTRVTFLGGAEAHWRNLSKTLPELTIEVGQISCVATTKSASQCYTLPGRTVPPAAQRLRPRTPDMAVLIQFSPFACKSGWRVSVRHSTGRSAGRHCRIGRASGISASMAIRSSGNRIFT